MGPQSTLQERYYSRTDAAKLCGRDASTIKRHDRAGKLPNARRRPGCPNGTVEYPLSDLIAAGLYTPPADGEAPDDTLDRVRAEQRILELTQQLADARARAEVHAERAKQLSRQVDKLTNLADRLAAGGGR